jgi:gliding motility-associated-like protein
VYRDTADIDFLLRSGGANLTNFDMVLKENQFPFVVDAVTQTQALRYRWFLNGQIQNGNGFTQGFTLPNSGVYTIDLLTQSVDSCIGKARKVLTIQELILPAPVIPNLVTINGDQQNEHFEIEQIPFYPDNELIIYNRWGKEIFRSRPYQNNWPPSDLSPGTYFYRLHAGEVTYQGWVEVVRN